MMPMTDAALTRADLDRLATEVRNDVRLLTAEFKAEYRQDMATQARWIAGVVILQFFATVSATSGVVFFMLNRMLP